LRLPGQEIVFSGRDVCFSIDSREKLRSIGGMGKQFRSCELNQALLLPPSLHDWLPEGHLARFVAEVVETLDLSAIYAQYEEGDGRGLAAYDPRMMERLLLYGYCRGGASSRRIERRRNRARGR